MTTRPAFCVGGNLSLLLGALLVLGAPLPAQGRIKQIEIARVESPTFGGASFGDVGPYEKLVGRAHGAVDPADPRNSVIVDRSLARGNARGVVDDSRTSTFCGGRSLERQPPAVFDINNRGANRAFDQLNDATRKRTITTPTRATAF